MKKMDELKTAIAAFANDRDWDQFHSPKNLAMALSFEVAELVEHFQWLTEQQSESLFDGKRAAVADEIVLNNGSDSATLEKTSLYNTQNEIADIQVYLIRLADKLEVNIFDAVDAKLAKNGLKYPADKVRGSSKKYSEYD